MHSFQVHGATPRILRHTARGSVAPPTGALVSNAAGRRNDQTLAENRLGDLAGYALRAIPPAPPMAPGSGRVCGVLRSVRTRPVLAE